MSTHFPHAVCYDCHWVQIHHAGNLRAVESHANDHRLTTGHNTRIKYHHEFADLLWTEEFILNAYGDTACENWLDTLSPADRELRDLYIHGSLTLEECEERYACTCEHCAGAEPRNCDGVCNQYGECRSGCFG